MHELYRYCRSISAAVSLVAMVVLIACVLKTAAVAAHELHAHAMGPHGGVHTHELGIAITCASPPYYYLNGDHGGREWVLIASAFEEIGHPARALYLPLSDATAALDEGWIDAVWVCADSETAPHNKLYLSEPLLPRKFVAITLAENNIAINSLSDLSHLTVAVHRDVETIIGKILQPIERDNPSFLTSGNHMLLAFHLFTNRVDVLIAEKASFEYFRQRLPQSVHPERPLAYHTVFPEVSPRLIFRDEMLRNEFNSEWQVVREHDLSLQSHPRVEVMPTNMVEQKGVSKE